jgi:S1-C subfamily serine protease
MMLALILALIMGLTACSEDWGGIEDTSQGEAGGTSATNATDTSTNLVTGGNGLVSPAAEVARVLGPSVVYIEATGTQNVPGYFQIPGQREYQSQWSGSGVIYTADGKIITNNHVVMGSSTTPADEIEVTLATGEKFPATVVGTDPLTDLAVIQIQTGFSLPRSRPICRCWVSTWWCWAVPIGGRTR